VTSTQLLAALLAASMAAAGCGSSDAKKTATQVVAKVNGEEISVHQVNHVLGRSSGISAENAPRVRQEVLDKLIDQQIAVQQAIDRKLDRDPAVMQSVEAARREILARAFLEKLTASIAKPTPEAVAKFYGEHPELFSARRVYSLQELALPADPALVAEVKQWVAQGKSMADIANTLKARDIKFAGNAGIRAAEQLPLDVAPKFQALKEGQTLVVEGGQGVMVAHVMGIKEQPIDQAAAAPRIQQFVVAQQANELITREMKALREKAAIERLGEFAAATPGATPAVAPAAAAPASAAATIDDKSLAKGVAGLK
jgi:EpsD family peptidyl-prolyl cis-trans isomerase